MSSVSRPHTAAGGSPSGLVPLGNQDWEGSARRVTVAAGSAVELALRKELAQTQEDAAEVVSAVEARAAAAEAKVAELLAQVEETKASVAQTQADLAKTEASAKRLRQTLVTTSERKRALNELEVENEQHKRDAAQEQERLARTQEELARANKGHAEASKYLEAERARLIAEHENERARLIAEHENLVATMAESAKQELARVQDELEVERERTTEAATAGLFQGLVASWKYLSSKRIDLSHTVLGAVSEDQINTIVDWAPPDLEAQFLPTGTKLSESALESLRTRCPKALCLALGCDPRVCLAL